MKTFQTVKAGRAKIKVRYNYDVDMVTLSMSYKTWLITGHLHRTAFTQEEKWRCFELMKVRLREKFQDLSKNAFDKWIESELSESEKLDEI